MRTIWKYEIDGVEELELPVGSNPLTVQVQDGKPVIWFEVCPSRDTRFRAVRINGTGLPLSTADGHYVGTYQQGPFVWHVYVGPEKR